eukprot:CAMPEP_0196655290 /NCGR_PEP_ID=MMETSP1086-20130531/5044_1 /TAXON_ID=77921 /ORGANISM="Cyanoptyche  gloeocystis , Strain SAG4.97" /LENGTH=359 /DNA_ID=CAMNT_0041987525 /DNA_START=94 /DNA_END=1173 /DNA_ORIENTATION=-
MAYAPRLNKAITEKFYGLSQNGKIQAEYIWIGNISPPGEDLRSKTRTLDTIPSSAADIPEWNYDGSSTGQAPGHDSEVILKAQRIYKDPFRGGDNILVLCDCYHPDGTPIPTNTRYEANQVMEAAAEFEPWFGIEQEYTLYTDDKVPLGWPRNGFPGPQGPYYCGVGVDKSFGRDIVEAHYRACLFAGVKIAGCNGEVMPGQWEYQVGPCEGIQAGDDLIMARFLLNRIAEEFGVIVSVDPKPIPGEWNGAGCHTNYSTKPMREPGGMDVIMQAIEKLSKKHSEHIAVYGVGNERRLTGKCETASIEKFSYGVANRGASVRIPRVADKQGFGYFEDRRPASNMDPYVVTSKLVKTTCLE